VPVILHQGAGSAEFTLTNPGITAVPLALRAGPFSDETSQTSLAGAKLDFSAPAGGTLPTKLAPGAEIAIQANVSDANGAGVAAATLFNGARELGRLPVVDADAPLNVSVGDGTAEQPLVLADGDDADLTLRNLDAEAYPLDWSFQVAGTTLQSGELQLAPHGSSRIELTPTDDLYSWTDSLRPSDRTGTLLLSLHGPPEVAKDLLPERTLHVNLLMRRLSPGRTSMWWHLFVTLILLVGGLLSVIANSVLPNILRKISMRRHLNALADRIGSLSTRLDPFLRGLLAMERKRVEILLKRARVLSLSSVEKLDEISEAIDQLTKRLKAVERLDDLRHMLEDSSLSAPPSITEEVDGKLRAAAARISSPAVAEEDLNAANAHMNVAETTLESLEDGDALAQRIAANFRELRVRQKLLPISYYSDMKAALPGLFELLNQPFEDPANITRPMMFAIDYGICALQLAFDYAAMRVSTPAATSLVAGTGVVSVQSPRDRLLARHDEMLGLLGTMSATSLRELRILVQEMRENVYDRDVLEEIATQGQAEIALDPQTVRRYAPILFSIRFKDPRFRNAAALRRLACKWDFPNFILDQQWKVVHFFQGNEKKRDEDGDLEIVVRVEEQKQAGGTGNEQTAGKPLRSMLRKTIEIQPAEQASYARGFAESVRFLIAVGVALAALFAGALQQLNKLDFLPAAIAVLALGFGADTVKNLLTQSARRAAI
jgi:hypothetical protein